MKKKIIIGVVIIFSIVLIGVINLKDNALAPNSERIQMVGSFYPLVHFAEIVGNERVSVRNLTPVGAEPHDYEPTPRDIVAIQNAKLILLNGAGFEPWFEAIENNGGIGGGIVTMSDHIDLLPTPHDETVGDDPCAPNGLLHEGHCDCNNGYRAEGMSCVANEGINTDNEEHNHGLNDPHFWLDPVRAQKEVEVVRDALIMIDGSGKDIYTNNADAYTQKLASLHDAYQKGLTSCKMRTIIVPHNAFQYLGNRYNINMVSIAGVSPDEEPSPKRIAELSDIAKTRGIKYVFFETLASPKLAETIAKEAGIGTLVLNPLEGLTPEEVQAGATYISVMEQNLEQLRKAMECE